MGVREHVVDFLCNRHRNLVRPGLEHRLCHLVGKLAGAEKQPPERGEHDEEGE
jgi:hypothetical protein